jgi:hypothetical protein
MKSVLALCALSLGLAAAPAAFADPGVDKAAPKAVKMSDAQLDNVVAGQLQVSEGLVNVQVGDVSIDVPVRILNNSVNNNTVQVPVAATVSAAVAVLGNAAAMAQQLGASATH